MRRQGAYDYLLKLFDLQNRDRVIGEALTVARLMREPAVVVGAPPDDDQPGEAIVGSWAAMQEVYKAIGRVADQTFARCSSPGSVTRSRFLPDRMEC